MPSVSASSSTVLITGASGYIAVWCCKYALEKGFQVVGTVRTAEKGEYLKNLLGSGFQYAIVEDISKEDAFDKVVKSNKFDAVLHTASPFHLKAEDPKELYDPAIKGTKGVLESITKAGGDSVKRVVVTSSFAAVITSSRPAPYTYTEEDWNHESEKVVEEKGKDASAIEKYRASKTLAEKAAWSYVKENQTSFDVVTINPVFVLGPILQEVKKPEGLNTSVALFYSVMKGSMKKDDLPGPRGNWIDVRDVAEAHVEALLRDVGGSRFNLSNGPYCIQNMTESLNKLAPHLDVVKGEPGAAKEANSKQVISSGAKCTKELGIKFRTWDESIKDMYDSVVEREKTVWNA